MSFTTVKLQLGHLLRQLGGCQRALDLHQEALDISLERAPFLLQPVESQLAMDWFALGDPEKGKQYFENANRRKKMGSIGSGFCLPYLAMAKVAWAQYFGDWEEALSTLNTAATEAAQRKLILHELLLQYETIRALTAMDAVGEAKKLKIALMDRADKKEIKFFDRSNSI